MDDVREAVDTLFHRFNEFKAANDARLKEIKARGAADPLLDEKVGRLNGEVSALQERVGTLDAAFRRTPRPGPIEAAAASAEQVEHRAAFAGYLRKGADGELGALEQKALSVGSDPEGGYLVPATMSERIVRTVFETSPIRAIAANVTIGTDAVEMLVDKDEAGAGWVAETGSRAETDTPDLAKLRVPVHELYAEPRATQKLLDDGLFDVESWLADKVADKMTRTENAAFVSGTGVGQPRGFLGYTAVADASWSWGSIGYVASGGSGAFASSNPADKLIALAYALKAAYRADASWVMNRATVAEVRKLKASDGHYLWQPGLKAGEPATLLGYPIAEAEDMPDIEANSLSIAFGNFRAGYLIVDRMGVRVLRDPFTAKPYVKFYTTKRVGGDVVNFEAIKLMKFANS
ncbi:MAG: phage major capsid protein [Rhodospirillaceae bacterium]|nr:phage major capsid protein [Rhodospirillaceae bacterium]